MEFSYLFLAGFLLWTLFEYLAHRFIFHLELSSQLGKYFVFVIHGNHHDQPTDKLRNMMPLVVSVPLALAFWYVGEWWGGRVGTSVFCGFLAGYITYDVIHYLCHQIRFKRGIMARLRRHHNLHHFASAETNYAVSNTFWDYVFSTKMKRPSQRS
ncbi:fatty acid hydroxylase [Saccharibacter sp. 17.LH.SD]|uniref:sterol desaturase family protein n=1 Tax=Saccharibacter sp. 17.LH.SD TaxID=2689393 RepID=UPI001370EFF0|nr:sterol desaturase family protein [Saccharibacter sp. 17.LH.SD]MXV43508.1 fatty acid hydroxylase [Saccharibacter sp. 17.LH.SD]